MKKNGISALNSMKHNVSYTISKTKLNIMSDIEHFVFLNIADILSFKALAQLLNIWKQKLKQIKIWIGKYQKK